MRIIKLISFCLALLLAFYAVPLNAYAVVATEDKLAEQTGTYETGTNELCEAESTNPIETTVPEITTTETTVYSFDYDAFGNTTGIDIGSDNIVSYEYAPYNGKLTKINYANGYSLEYVYDAVENLTEIWYTVNGARALAYSYEYTSKGQLARVRDHINGNETTYRYSLSGQL